MRLVWGLCAFLSAVILAAPLEAEAPPACNPAKGLGVARTVEIDTRGGPWFGTPHGDPDFLRSGEVVLTFDDGPLPHSTRPILWALASECTKATFFVVGRMAAAYPDIVRDMAVQGHTIGTHTWSHANLQTVSTESMRTQIESAFAAVEKAAERPIAPFFRFPYLASTGSSIAYLQSRDIAQFAVDIDSLDWRFHNAQSVVRTVMARLDARGRGIVLLHDIHPSTALAVPTLLQRLREKGYKVVHMRPKTPVQTLEVAGLPTRRVGPSERLRRNPARVTEGGWTWKWPW